MVNFIPQVVFFAAIGGVILGIATSLNYIIRGKVTGMSGIVWGVVSLNKGEMPQKLSVIGGMFLISSIFFLIFGYHNYNGFQPFGPQNEIAYWTTFPGFALAGLLVGFGTKLGNGCTSGHGLCGIARFSIRSIVAVCVFLFTAIGISTLSVYIGLGPFVNFQDRWSDLSPQIDYNHTISAISFLVIGALLPIIGFGIAKSQNPSLVAKSQIIDQLIVFGVGVLFAIGLMTSGMTRRYNILTFLQINQNWNPALLFVLGCGLIVNFITFTIMRRQKISINGNKVFDPQGNKIDLKLVLGAFCFGLGWGIGGLCPGPFLCLFSVFTVPIQVLWGVCFILGQFLADHVGKCFNPLQQAKPALVQAQPIQQLSGRPSMQNSLMGK